MSSTDRCKEADCPYLTGGKCWSDLSSETKAVVKELRQIRARYDDMELQTKGSKDTFEQPPTRFVSWRGWKMIRNVITDRIEKLTGSRR